MPTFFDPNNLSPEQAARWPQAVSTYDRVVREVARAAWEELDEADRQFLRARGAQKGKTEEEVCFEYGGVEFHQAGSPQSALFGRLLDGKEPLPYPPPLSYAYPWYEVVEEAGPFPVSVGGIVAADSLRLKGSRLKEATFAALVNQTAWAVLDLNEAATALREALATKAPSPELQARVRELYRAGPVVRICHGPWGPFELAMGPQRSAARRDYAEKVVSQGARLDNLWDPHDCALNARIGETLVKQEHPAQRLQQLKDEHARRPAGAVFSLGDPLLLGIQTLETSLAKATTEYEANPAGQDFVELWWDGWVLRRV